MTTIPYIEYNDDDDDVDVDVNAQTTHASRVSLAFSIHAAKSTRTAHDTTHTFDVCYWLCNTFALLLLCFVVSFVLTQHNSQRITYTRQDDMHTTRAPGTHLNINV